MSQRWRAAPPRHPRAPRRVDARHPAGEPRASAQRCQPVSRVPRATGLTDAAGRVRLAPIAYQIVFLQLLQGPDMFVVGVNHVDLLSATNTLGIHASAWRIGLRRNQCDAGAGQSLRSALAIAYRGRPDNAVQPG